MEDSLSSQIKISETVSAEKSALAKKYAKTNQLLSLTETVIFFAAIVILLFTGLSKRLKQLLTDLLQMIILLC